VAELHRELQAALAGLGRPYEILLVDDGSRDGTAERLREVEAADAHVRVLTLRRNFGQTAAFCAGFDHARGEVVVTSDGDLQNDPADIPRLVAKLDEGYDMVCGWRSERQDPCRDVCRRGSRTASSPGRPACACTTTAAR
jgi:glycosyltransferase involved in cell wall biosynthesis